MTARRARCHAAIAYAAATFFVGGLAGAQTVVPTVSCYDAAARPNVVYVAGSTAVKPFLGTLGQLTLQTSPPYTLVYQSQGSCTGVNAIFSADASKRVINDIPASGGKPANYAVFVKGDGSTQECSLEAAGTPIDVGISDVFAPSCGAAAPAGVTIADYSGPIQPMTFVVPAASSQRSISAEAAYMAFGLGGARAAPWLDPTLFFVRNASSGTQQMVARAIGVPAEQWWGTDRGGSGAVQSGLKVILDAATAEKSIGILSTDLADPERSNLRVLAFRGRGQLCGFLPDSSASTFDKKNVRDGHYPIWGPVHLFARTAGGLPSAAAAALVSRFATPKVDQTLLDAEIGKNLVPQCAMHVKRDSELGPLSSFQPTFGCGCYFDAKTNGASSCKACRGPADCPSTAPSCNLGFCEP